MRFLACTDNKANTTIDKGHGGYRKTVTGKNEEKHKIFRVTLNSADYPAGGFIELSSSIMMAMAGKKKSTPLAMTMLAILTS